MFDKIFYYSSEEKRPKDKRDYKIKKHRVETRCGCATMMKISCRFDKFQTVEFVANRELTALEVWCQVGQTLILNLMALQLDVTSDELCELRGLGTLSWIEWTLTMNESLEAWSQITKPLKFSSPRRTLENSKKTFVGETLGSLHLPEAWVSSEFSFWIIYQH